MATRRILHAADIHLDSPLQKLESYEHAPVARIRAATRRALENVVQLAIDREVDLVVIAGDLYDGDWPDQNTGLFFVAQASRLVQAGIPLVVIRGNHDAANVMTSSLPLPKNPDGSEIMMASDRVDRRTFEPVGIAVHGRSFRSRAETENLAADYPPPISGMFNLGLLHTSLTGAVGHDSYAPCTPTQLAEKNYDYWALGHVHKRGQLGLPGTAPVVFSGNTQGRHIRESGTKGCVLIEVDERNACRHEFHAADVVRWQQLRIDAADMKHVDEVVDEYQRQLVNTLQQVDGRMLVVRAELVGQTDLHDLIHHRRNSLSSALRATTVQFGTDQAWLESMCVSTSAPQRAPLLNLDGPLECLAQEVHDLRSDDQLPALIEAELRSLRKKLPNEVVFHQEEAEENGAWLGRLLDEAYAEIHARLVSDPEGTA